MAVIIDDKLTMHRWLSPPLLRLCHCPCALTRTNIHTQKNHIRETFKSGKPMLNVE